MNSYYFDAHIFYHRPLDSDDPAIHTNYP